MSDLVGDIFDNCVNPLSAAQMKLERLSSERPDDADLQDALRLVQKATQRFCMHRARWYEAQSIAKRQRTG